MINPEISDAVRRMRGAVLETEDGEQRYGLMFKDLKLLVEAADQAITLEHENQQMAAMLVDLGMAIGLDQPPEGGDRG